MNAVVVALGTFLAGVLVFGACVFVVRRFVDLPSLLPNNETVAHHLGIVIGVYGIFSGFVIVALWEQQGRADDNIVREASELREVFRLGGTLSGPAREEIQEAAIDYARTAIQKEWPRLSAGDESLNHDHPAKDRIWAVLKDYEPSEHESVFYEALFAHFENLSECRRNRCYDAQRTLPAYLWLILIIGSVLSIACTLLIGAENLRTQALLTGISGGLLMLLVFVVYDLQTPFRGFSIASPRAFELALERMEYSLQHDLPSRAPQAGSGTEVH